MNCGRTRHERNSHDTITTRRTRPYNVVARCRQRIHGGDDTRGDRLRDTGGLPMTPEQKAALDRLRNSKYWSSDIDDNRQWFDDVQYWKDIRTLLKAYDSEHPTDDDVPVDEEWLRSVGFVKHEALWQWAAGTDGLLRVLYWPEYHHGEWWIESPDNRMSEIPDAKTRGDVRRLCRALGIELKE